MNLLTKLRYVPKHYAAVLAVVAATATVATTLAWGPSRTTFTVEKPATYVTFNSITNNPVDGDERNFSRAKDANGAWSDSVAVKPGQTYKVRMVVHNNAADNLNLKALNTRATAAVPTTTGKSVTVSNYVSADNANPARVWDDVTFTSADDFNLAYVPGSARIYNSGYAAGGNGQPLPDSIVTSAGAKLGYNAAGDGIIPGCFKYLSYVEYTVKPQFAASANFETTKSVRKAGETSWVESVNAKAGDKVQYRIKYTNKATVQQDNVTVRDALPKGVSYVNGTTKLYLGSDPNTARPLSDNLTKSTGVNIGSYAPGGMAMIIFDATVDGNDALPTCGPNTLKNVASVETDYGTKSDDAVVNVTKECKPVVEKEKVCELATKNTIDIETKNFDASKHSRDFNDCETTVPGKQSVCEIENGNIVVIDEGDFDKEVYTDDLNVCKPEETTTTETPETPGTPETIASTGPGSILAGLFGSSALGYGAYSFYQSRRASAGSFIKR